MTTYDHVVTMIKTTQEKTAKVADLKARLSAYLRTVRRGHPVIVCDRDTPIARLVPYVAEGEPLTVRQAIGALHDVALPPPLGRPVDSLGALLEERQTAR